MHAPRFGLTSNVLIVVNLTLAMIIALQTLFPSAPSNGSAAAGGDVAALLPDFGDATLDPPLMSDMPDMLERPLFFADRRMPKPAAEAPPPPPTPLRLKLEGIALSGGARVAVLRNLQNNQLVQLEEGDRHDGWTLDSLTSTSASFSRSADR